MRLAALLLLAAAGVHGAAAADAAPPTPPVLAASQAAFERELPSADARHIALWIAHSGDNKGLPYIILDKVGARLFVFAADGSLRGATAPLIGLARGDDSVPGIGSRKLSTIRPEERTTPAGRFVAVLDRALNGDEVLWVDYDAGVALHRVIATVPKERRLQRLESAAPAEHRITYGCINVPVKFYDAVITPMFRGTEGIVYVLPETRPAQALFGSYDAANPPADFGRQAGSTPGASR